MFAIEKRLGEERSKKKKKWCIQIKTIIEEQVKNMYILKL
jgi:hypothetical protein